MPGPAEPVRTEIVHKSDDAAPVPAWGLLSPAPA